jgi:transcriptional regulator with XRE-family HTH domain
MGRASRPKPKRLAEKLLRVRLALGVSQNGMLQLLGLKEDLFQGSISGYELGTREPPLPVLLAYARRAGISTDVLIDDDLDLPDKLSVDQKKEDFSRRSTKVTKTKSVKRR